MITKDSISRELTAQRIKHTEVEETDKHISAEVMYGAITSTELERLVKMKGFIGLTGDRGITMVFDKLIDL